MKMSTGGSGDRRSNPSSSIRLTVQISEFNFKNFLIASERNQISININLLL